MWVLVCVWGVAGRRWLNNICQSWNLKEMVKKKKKPEQKLLGLEGSLRMWLYLNWSHPHPLAVLTLGPLPGKTPAQGAGTSPLLRHQQEMLLLSLRDQQEVFVLYLETGSAPFCPPPITDTLRSWTFSAHLAWTLLRFHWQKKIPLG